MKILVILVSHEMNPENIPNIEIINKYLHTDNKIDYCGISSKDDFHNYESVITFKYKMINTKRQLSKICDFITKMTKECNDDILDYDWYIKMRPDLKLLEPIDFTKMSHMAINARARVYRGPQKVMYGMSINGEGRHKNEGWCWYDEHEKELILDDCMYIFTNNVIKMGAFNMIRDDSIEHEWIHTNIWNERNVPLKLVGINVICLKYDLEPGHVNM